MGNGQKITRWPIKYPHIKKNAQPLLFAALQASVNTHMPYYDVYCTRGSIQHQEYVYLASEEDAQALKEEMSNSYDVVGVNRITKKQYLARVSQK